MFLKSSKIIVISFTSYWLFTFRHTLLVLSYKYLTKLPTKCNSSHFVDTIYPVFSWSIIYFCILIKQIVLYSIFAEYYPLSSSHSNTLSEGFWRQGRLLRLAQLQEQPCYDQTVVVAILSLHMIPQPEGDGRSSFDDEVNITNSAWSSHSNVLMKVKIAKSCKSWFHDRKATLRRRYESRHHRF